MRDILEPLRIALGDTTAFGLAVVLTAGDCRKAIDEIEQLRQRIATLEAEKAERERQEQVEFPSDEELMAFGAEEEHFLLCDSEGYTGIARDLLAKFGRCRPCGKPSAR